MRVLSIIAASSIGLVAAGCGGSRSTSSPPAESTVAVPAERPGSPTRWPPYPHFSSCSCWTRPLGGGVMRAAPEAVTGREWKTLINDWYDGQIDGSYPCAVVQEAIRHLPTTPPMFSTVLEDLDSYERTVCPPTQP